jgi:transposase
MASSTFRWPVHLKPKDDELLSSWLARLSLAHGLHPSSLCSIVISTIQSSHYQNGKVLWHRDIDRNVSTQILSALADKTGIEIERIRGTALAAYEGWIYERLNTLGNAQWVMPISSSPSSGKCYGLQYCPRCLSEDEEPYFRRSWRLAFITLCKKHSTQLLDRCEVCKEPINYRRGIYGSLHNPPTGNLASCANCKTDLRHEACSKVTPPASVEIYFQDSLVRAAREGWVNIPGSGPVYSHLYFTVLRKLMVLLASGSKGSFLRQYVSLKYGNMNFEVKLGYHTTMERLNVSERRRLLGMTRELLSDWPDRFIDFCRANKLSITQLFHLMDYIPFWYWNVVNEHLNRAKYWRTVQEVEAALKYLDRAYDKCRAKRHFPTEAREVSKFLNSVKVPTRQRIWKQFGVPDRRLKVNRRSNKLYNQSPRKTEMQMPRPISDDLWEIIKPLMPRGKPRRQKVDDRAVLNGILYVLSTSCTWHEMPPIFGTVGQVYCRYQRWKRIGAFNKIWDLCSHWYDNDRDISEGTDM